MTRSRFHILVTLVLVGILLVLGVAYLKTHLSASIFYDVAAHYTHMPSDDQALKAWIKSQPGVVARTVHVERKGDELRVTFIMSQTVFGRQPPFPKQGLLDTCASLGYGPPTDWKYHGVD